MKKTFTLTFLACFANFLLAQDDELPPPTSKPKQEKTESKTSKPDEGFKGFGNKKKFDFSKIIIEPNFNFSIAQGRIDAGLSPYVGYQIFHPKKAPSNIGLYAGGGITYFFTQINVQGVDQYGKVHYGKAKFHTYGGGVFLQYNIWRGLFIRSKFELLHRTLDDLNNATIGQNNKITFAKIQKTYPSLLLGAGYNLLQSKNFFIPILVSYNVLHPFTDNTYAIYPRGLVVQLGFINIF